MTVGKRRMISLLNVTTLLLAVAAVLVLGSSGFAITPGGGNDASTDCFIEIDGVSSNPVECTDGDSSCDSDSVTGSTSGSVRIRRISPAVPRLRRSSP